MNDENIPPLYHYTTQDGLLGIINSRSLWFTNILYLNDASEFNYIFNLVQDELNLKAKNRLVNVLDPKYSLIVDFLKDTLEVEAYIDVISFYVFSFSRVEDQLSQWRGYCGNESGYCIEFDADKIISFVGNNKVIIVRCIYEQQQQRKLIQKIIDEAYAACDKQSVIDVLKKMKQGIRTNQFTKKDVDIIKVIQGDFFTNLFLNAPVFKHPKFFEEKEMRLITAHGKSMEFKPMFRTSKSMLIPYHEIKIAGDGDEMPINKIIVGPTNHPELSKGAVENLLLVNSIDCVVELSEIPYRA